MGKQAKTLTEAVKASTYSTPKNSLGFFAAVMAVVVSGAIGGTAVLAGNDDLRHLVVWLWVFTLLIVVGLIAVVVIMMFRDPSKLMLGQISGHEYVAIHSMTQGDSVSGEHVERIIPAVPVVPALEGDKPRGVPPQKREESP